MLINKRFGTEMCDSNECLHCVESCKKKKQLNRVTLQFPIKWLVNVCPLNLVENDQLTAVHSCMWPNSPLLHVISKFFDISAWNQSFLWHFIVWLAIIALRCPKLCPQSACIIEHLYSAPSRCLTMTELNQKPSNQQTGLLTVLLLLLCDTLKLQIYDSSWRFLIIYVVIFSNFLYSCMRQ